MASWNTAASASSNSPESNRAPGVPCRRSSSDLYLQSSAFEFGVIEFSNDGVGMLGIDVDKRVTFPDIYSSDYFSRQSGVSGDRVYHLDWLEVYLFSDVQEQAGLISRRSPAVFGFGRWPEMGSLCRLKYCIAMSF